MSGQQFDFAKKVLSYQVGTGKDAKIFIKFIVDREGKKEIYNIPLLTLNSIQLFSKQAKVPRHAFGSADPKGLSIGIKSYSGFITATTLNESIGKKIRRKLAWYKPVKADNLTLDTDGIIDLRQLDELQYLDQLPPCQLMLYMTSPETKKVFSKMVYGVTFTNESHSTGTAMSEQYSFVATDASAITLEEISAVKEAV
ncbi:MAG: ribose-phosphate pyrophosphokinase [Fusobacteriaceae bacterium]